MPESQPVDITSRLKGSITHAVNTDLEAIGADVAANYTTPSHRLGKTCERITESALKSMGIVATVDREVSKTVTDTQGKPYGTSVDLEATLDAPCTIQGAAGASNKLSIEVKSGHSDYLLQELKPDGHVTRQTAGHEGLSVVVVSEEYFAIGARQREQIENHFKEAGVMLLTTLPRRQAIAKAADVHIVVAPTEIHKMAKNGDKQSAHFVLDDCADHLNIECPKDMRKLEAKALLELAASGKAA